MPYEVKYNKIHWHLCLYSPEVELLIEQKWEMITVFLILLYLKDSLKMHMVGRGWWGELGD